MSKQTKTAFPNEGVLPLVIVNPNSASGATNHKWLSTARELRTHFGPFNVAFTKSLGDGIDIAEREARGGRVFIIACGGDGTINEVANGIIKSGRDVELGILPSGTGGDFRRTLDLPLANRDAAVILREGRTQMIDAGLVTFMSQNGRTVSRYFLNISSVGLAAAVIKRVKSSTTFGWLPSSGTRGKASFALAALQEVLSLEPVSVRVRIDDGEERILQTINLCVANSRYFGGGMKIAPNASVNDGLLDVISIGDMRATKILWNLASLYRGTHIELDEVKSTQARKVMISAVNKSDDILLETDGEMPGKLPATYEIVPNAIRVRVPK